MQIISSQRHIDYDIVAQKLATEDYAVTLSPEFEIDGETYCVVLDGHHSLAAAVEAGVQADYSTADATAHDAVALLDRGEIEDFLLATHMGDDYYDVATGKDIW